MGLAAVPFGTAQATDYEIKVTQEHKPDAEHFKISIGEVGKESSVAHIVWSHNKEYPNPIFEPNGFMEMYENKLEKRFGAFNTKMWRYEYCFENLSSRSAWINLLKWYNFYGDRLPVANWEYHVRKACEGLGLRVVSSGFAEKIEKFIKKKDFAEEIKEFIGDNNAMGKKPFGNPSKRCGSRRHKPIFQTFWWRCG